jgi:hypothetical protein
MRQKRTWRRQFCTLVRKVSSSVWGHVPFQDVSCHHIACTLLLCWCELLLQACGQQWQLIVTIPITSIFCCVCSAERLTQLHARLSALLRLLLLLQMRLWWWQPAMRGSMSPTVPPTLPATLAGACAHCTLRLRTFTSESMLAPCRRLICNTKSNLLVIRGHICCSCTE